MAKKKAGGSSGNGRDSKSKRLGFKLYNNNIIKKGSIILRQKGTKFFPSKFSTGLGKDKTIYALKNGYIKFYKKSDKKYIKII